MRKINKTEDGESEFIFSLLAQESWKMIFINQGGRVVYASQKFAELMGYSLEELTSHEFDFMKLISPGSKHPTWDSDNEHSLEHKVPNYEYSLVTKDGKLLHSLIATMPIRFQGANAILGIVIDFTERMKTEEALRKTEAHLRTAIQHESLIFAETDLDLRYTWIYHAHPEFPTDSIIGKRDDELAGNEGARQLMQLKQQTINSEKSMRRDIVFPLPTGPRTYDVITQPIRNLKGKVTGVASCSLDITEHKRSEQATRRSEENIRNINNNLTSGMVYQLLRLPDGSRRFTYLSDSVKRMYGIIPQEGIDDANLIYSRVYEEDRIRVLKEEEEANEKLSIFKTEVRIVNPDGSFRWSSFVSNPSVLENGITRWDGIELDITERKNAELELQRLNERFRSLAANLQHVRDDEDARIAREIHDELGQLLTGVKMEIANIEDLVSAIASLAHRDTILERLHSASSLTDRVIQSMRNITSRIRPAIWDTMDLTDAIDWQLEEFQKRTAINCTFSPRTIDTKIDYERSTAIFKILQESLFNIVRHSGAKNITITLDQSEDKLTMDVADDGRGINPGDLMKATSFGILGMQERANLLGGSLTIKERNNGGTIVHLEIPCHHEVEKKREL